MMTSRAFNNRVWDQVAIPLSVNVTPLPCLVRVAKVVTFMDEDSGQLQSEVLPLTPLALVTTASEGWARNRGSKEKESTFDTTDRRELAEAGWEMREPATTFDVMVIHPEYNTPTTVSNLREQVDYNDDDGFQERYVTAWGVGDPAELDTRFANDCADTIEHCIAELKRRAAEDEKNETA